MSIYEEVEIEDLDFDPKKQIYSYPCPCGDRFTIKLEDMWEFGEDIATCPSCTLRIMVIYDEDDLPELRQDPEDIVYDIDDQLKCMTIDKNMSSATTPKEESTNTTALLPQVQ
mmetsp:Transcript_18817/g.26679  ORF Transcript_18817/g.26679 Transcript_18817/m.26679 type:complete len:113 (-) Transcript_18817:390-728(-)